MSFNKVGIYYVHWEQHDFIWRSIVSQADFVDYIFVLDSSLEKKEFNIPKYYKHKVEIEHTHKFGSGFENQYGLGYFEQVEARNYAMNKVFEHCDFMFPCDADEFLSPQAFIWARTAKNVILNIPEIVWRTEDQYTLSPHRHNRGGDKLSGIKHIPNPNTPWLKQGGFHKSRHVVFSWNKTADMFAPNVSWHNHLHYLYHPFNPDKVEVFNLNPGDSNFLYNGMFPSAYKTFINKRMADPNHSAREVVKK
jgi:hypothetical protein